MYQIKFMRQFQKDFQSLSVTEQKAVKTKIALLAKDPSYPSLRTKKVKDIENVFEMSVNMDIRILWQYENGIIILLLDVGHHKEILGV
jgi:mRNA-degrading endonuclease RelE of RelBE toxin-antitoxin system